MPQRFDAIRLDAGRAQRTAAGYVKVPALVTRSGVFTYKDAAGNTIREWRPPDEVLRADSLASLQDAAVTDRHPREMVSPKNHSKYSIGHVGAARKDEKAQGAEADLVFTSDVAIGKLGADLKEVSCGYELRLDATPGTVPAGMPDAGQHYDRVQRDIFYNHVAVGPDHWGRQGPDVSLRLDGADEVAPALETETETARRDAAAKGNQTMKIRFDGKTFEAATEAELQAQIDAYVATKGASDLSTQLAAEKGRADSLATQLATAQTTIKELPAKLRTDAAERVRLEASVSKVLGADFKVDGLSDDALRVAVIKHFDSKFDETGKEPAYLRGRFDTFLSAGVSERRDTALEGLSGLRQDGRSKHDAPEARSDSREVHKDACDPNDPDPELAQREMRHDMGEAWRPKAAAAE